MSYKPLILGISAYFHDSSAALIHGEKILAAAQEERFSRKKSDSSFPVNAINFCLSKICEEQTLDAIVFYENPMLKLERIFKELAANWPKGGAVLPQLVRTVFNLNVELPEKLLEILNDGNKIYFCDHHLSHAASAFLPSNLQNSAVLIVDGVGEKITTSIYSADRQNIKPLAHIDYPHSLGIFYSAFTQLCGFKVNSGEYKLMGLAPFGNPRFTNLIMENLIDIKEDGSFILNIDYFSFQTANSTINPLFEDLFKVRARHPSDPITQKYRDIAASAQKVLEEVMLRLSKTALKLSNSKNLCLAGGVALNCVSNSNISNNIEEVENIWIQPAAGDAGGALGAAMYLASTKYFVSGFSMSPYLGPDYSEEEIERVLTEYGIRFNKYDDEATQLAAICEYLDKGRIVGLFEGRSEFGPRALGNRSIIADARKPDALKKTNLKIKFRESWRPFAPSVLKSEADKIFSGDTDSPYMLKVSAIKSEHRLNAIPEWNSKGMALTKILSNQFSNYPAITHCDYSSRLQTVDEANGKYFRLLTEFNRTYGCPLLLNTSFNVRGEPIVESPKDAVDCFLNTHMDVLAIGKYLIRKVEQDNFLKQKVGRVKFNAD